MCFLPHTHAPPVLRDTTRADLAVRGRRDATGHHLDLVGFRPVEVRALEPKLARADTGVILRLRVEAAEAVNDHRALDGEAEPVLRGERERLAGVNCRRDDDAADGVGHGL